MIKEALVPFRSAGFLPNPGRTGTMAAPLASLENLTKVDLQYLVGAVFNGKVYSELTKAQLADKLRLLIAREQEIGSSSESAATTSKEEPLATKRNNPNILSNMK